jgi:membrane protease YdiL (CAAX protease family)
MKNIFKVTNLQYDKYETDLKAKTCFQKVLVFINYILPGVIVLLLINVKNLHDYLSDYFHISSEYFQFWVLIGLTFGWHIAYPIYMLKVKKKYTWKQVKEALNINQFTLKGFFVITPLFFVLVLILAVPYMGILFTDIHEFLQSIDFIAIPEHSLFYDYSKIYSLAPWQIGLLFIGNFVGEEIYFRGYLLKKSAFLGNHNWWIHSILFSAYHLWQIPMTYSLSFISLSFGLYMIWRKNLFELMLLHLMINLLLPIIVQLAWS